jgi:hypothetical protein
MLKIAQNYAPGTFHTMNMNQKNVLVGRIAGTWEARRREWSSGLG